MRNEHGTATPAVLIFIFLFIALFLHQANLLVLEKRFYTEAEQFTRLENMMNNAVVTLQKDIQAGMEPTMYQYEDGVAQLTNSPISPTAKIISIQCTTVEGRKYKVRFLYDVTTRTITNWVEER